MPGNIELRTKHQFAGLLERRDRLALLKNDGDVQGQFTQLVGPTWARDNCALDEIIEPFVWPSGSQDDKGLRQLNTHIAAARWLLSCSQNQASLSSADLLELHRRLLEGIRPKAGCFRESEIAPLFEGHEPMEVELIPYVVENALEWFNSDSFHEMHEVEKTALMLMKLVDIFPFEEGNGRTLRLFSSFFLLKAGYPPAIIGPATASQYAIALENCLKFHTQPLIDLLAEAVLHGLQFSLGEPASPPSLPILR